MVGKYQIWYCQIVHFKFQIMETQRVQLLKIMIHWKFHKGENMAQDWVKLMAVWLATTNLSN